MRILAGVLVLLLVQESREPPLKIHFDVDCRAVPVKEVAVAMTIDGNRETDVVVSIPAWAPGSYRLQNFYQNLAEISAENDGKKLEVEKVDNQTWRVKARGTRKLTVGYRVKVSARNSGETFYDCIGPATFLYVVDRKDAPCSVRFGAPKGWKIATGLAEKDGVYHGRDYDTFIDCPSMIGLIEVLEFDEGGCRYQLANVGPVPDQAELGLALKDLAVTGVTAGGLADKAGIRKGDLLKKANGEALASVADLGRAAWKLHEPQKITIDLEREGKPATVELAVPVRVDPAKLIDVHRKIVAAHMKMFGGAPFDRYVFLNYFKRQMGGGGLEHLNSCHIDFPYDSVKRDPATIASLNSHEFIHAWNVKRIRPLELGPFDYTRAVRSKHLWLCEGVTSYYGDLALARSGLWSEQRYFGHLAGTIQQVEREPERRTRSIEDFSEKEWDRSTGYYYVKGEILGLLLDLRIRTLTKNAKSFDDVMRHLYETYVATPAKEGKGWIGVGFPRNGIRQALKDVSGHDFGGFYDKYISGAEDLPYEEVFKAAGLAYGVTKAPDLGVPLRRGVVLKPPAGSAAEKAGFKEGDRITKINGAKLEPGGLSAAVRALEIGKEAKVTVERDGKEVELTIVVGAAPQGGVSLKRAEDATPEQKKLVDSWLQGRQDY